MTGCVDGHGAGAGGGGSPVRRRLPRRREHRTVEVSGADGARASVAVALFAADGTAAEVFIRARDAREGSQMSALADDAGIVLSLALQYGVSAAALARALTRDGGGERRSVLGLAIDAALAAEADAAGDLAALEVAP